MAGRWPAIAWLLQGLTNGYFLLFLPVLGGMWLVVVHPPGASRPGVRADRGDWVLRTPRDAAVSAALPRRARTRRAWRAEPSEM